MGMSFDTLHRLVNKNNEVWDVHKQELTTILKKMDTLPSNKEFLLPAWCSYLRKAEYHSAVMQRLIDENKGYIAQMDEICKKR